MGTIEGAFAFWLGKVQSNCENWPMNADRGSKVILFSSFGIWVIYGTLAGMRQWPAAVVFGMVASIAMLLFAGFSSAGIKLLDWVMLSYFVIAAVATFAIRSGSFPIYSPILIWFLYAVVTWASILIGFPFSTQYSRLSVPKERWNSPAFERSNQIISTVWGVAFVINVTLVTITLNPRYGSLFLAVFAPLLMMGASALFTKYYAKAVHERAQQATERSDRTEVVEALK
jgi:hypothetical protein